MFFVSDHVIVISYNSNIYIYTLFYIQKYSLYRLTCCFFGCKLSLRHSFRRKSWHGAGFEMMPMGGRLVVLGSLNSSWRAWKKSSRRPGMTGVDPKSATMATMTLKDLSTIVGAMSWFLEEPLVLCQISWLYSYIIFLNWWLEIVLVNPNTDSTNHRHHQLRWSRSW